VKITRTRTSQSCRVGLNSNIPSSSIPVGNVISAADLMRMTEAEDTGILHMTFPRTKQQHALSSTPENDISDDAVDSAEDEGMDGHASGIFYDDGGNGKHLNMLPNHHFLLDVKSPSTRHYNAHHQSGSAKKQGSGARDILERGAAIANVNKHQKRVLEDRVYYTMPAEPSRSKKSYYGSVGCRARNTARKSGLGNSVTLDGTSSVFTVFLETMGSSIGGTLLTCHCLIGNVGTGFGMAVGIGLACFTDLSMQMLTQCADQSERFSYSEIVQEYLGVRATKLYHVTMLVFSILVITAHLIILSDALSFQLDTSHAPTTNKFSLVGERGGSFNSFHTTNVFIGGAILLFIYLLIFKRINKDDTCCEGSQLTPISNERGKHRNVAGRSGNDKRLSKSGTISLGKKRETSLKKGGEGKSIWDCGCACPDPRILFGGMEWFALALILCGVLYAVLHGPQIREETNNTPHPNGADVTGRKWIARQSDWIKQARNTALSLGSWVSVFLRHHCFLGTYRKLSKKDRWVFPWIIHAVTATTTVAAIAFGVLGAQLHDQLALDSSLMNITDSQESRMMKEPIPGNLLLIGHRLGYNSDYRVPHQEENIERSSPSGDIRAREGPHFVPNQVNGLTLLLVSGLLGFGALCNLTLRRPVLQEILEDFLFETLELNVNDHEAFAKAILYCSIPCIVALSSFIALIIPDLEKSFSLLGFVCGILLVFIFPGIVYYEYIGRKPHVSMNAKSSSSKRICENSMHNVENYSEASSYYHHRHYPKSHYPKSHWNTERRSSVFDSLHRVGAVSMACTGMIIGTLGLMALVLGW